MPKYNIYWREVYGFHVHAEVEASSRRGEKASEEDPIVCKSV